MDSPTAPKPITGRSRIRKTKWSVLWVDRAAKILIASGGIGTIVAVATVFVFLTSVALMLFFPTQVGPPEQIPLETVPRPRYLACDEYGSTGWTLDDEGNLRAFRLDDGHELLRRPLDKDETAKLTAFAFQQDGEHAIFGFDDGGIRLGRIYFNTRFITWEKAAEPLRKLKVGESAELKNSMAARVADDLFRVSDLVVSLDDKIEGISDSPIVRLDSVETQRDDQKIVQVFCALTKDGGLRFCRASKSSDEDEKEWKVPVKSTVPPAEGKLPPPDFLLMAGSGLEAYAAWTDGRLQRYDLRNLKKPAMVEEINLLFDDAPDQKTQSEKTLRLTDLRLLLGGTTLLAGDSSGRVRAWFSVKLDVSRDANHLVAAHELPGPTCAVSCIAANPRHRVCAIGYANGDVRLYYVTNERLLADMKTSGAGPAATALIAPRGDVVIAADDKGLTRWNVDLRHPEATLGSLFGKVWYEGYSEPSYTWQSSGPQDAEKKYSLTPLIFGTVKATLYSLLFGAPLALLAAIFTSEFMHPRAKARVKPIIEMMASLPSVVLGFLAGVIFAPLIEKIVPQVISAFFLIPVAFMTGAYLWQFLPRNVALRFQSWKLACVAVFLPLGIWASCAWGPRFEELLFDGDIKRWLSNPRRYTNGTAGWLLLLLPLAGCAVAVFVSRLVSPYIRRHTRDLKRAQLVLIDFGKFIAGLGLTVVVAWVLAAFMFHVCGLDPRDPEPLKHDLGIRVYPLSTYDTRNAMILGFMMGFAIIPIIYTVAEDALSSVPQHLRSASLGAGATPWQTAIRIVVPTAMSGLFSAVMIGLGRAVGETMIVLMAAGNTSIMEFNFFNGFQTLSAAIATQLSEANPGGTLYRTLFLAGLTLFGMTFVLNTVAEAVRLRFRRRAHEL